MDSLETTQNIAGKNVTVILELRQYSEEKYFLDFQDFVTYQTRKEKFSSKTDKEWTFYNLKEYRSIPYDYFLKTSIAMLSEVVFQILKENPSIMVSSEPQFKIRFILYRQPKREWYFEGDPKEVFKGFRHKGFLESIKESVEYENYVVAGVFLIQALVAPWAYFKRFDYSYVRNYLVHELEHHKQTMLNFFSYEDRIREKIRKRFPRLDANKFVPKLMTYNVEYVVIAIRTLVSEGTANLSTMEYKDRTEFNMNAVTKFKKDIEKLTRIKGKKE